MDELLPAGGAVQGADLVEVPGDVLQSGHVDHQLIANGGPEQQQDDGDLAQGRVRQPSGALGDAEDLHDYRVDDSVAAEHEAEHRRQRHGAGDVGDEERHTQGFHAVGLAVEQVGQTQGEQNGGGDRKDGIDRRVADAGKEVLVFQDLPEVLQSHELDALEPGEEVPLRKGEQQGRHKGEHHKRQEYDQRRQNERPADPILFSFFHRNILSCGGLPIPESGGPMGRRRIPFRCRWEALTCSRP